jgi:peroxiredoxin
MRKGIIALAAAMIVALPLTASAARLKVGDPHVPFSLKSHDGKTVESATVVGKSVVVLNFMNTVCSTCNTELTDMTKLLADNTNVQFFPVAVDMRGEKSVPEYIANNGFKFTFLLDPTFATARKYGASSTPYTVVIGKEGNVKALISGYDDDVKAEIKKALK